MFWKKLHFGRTFSVISADAEFVRGGKFHRKGKHWKMISFVSEKITEDAPLAAWRKVSRQIGLAEYRVVTGKVDGVAFFRFPSVAMDSSAQRGNCSKYRKITGHNSVFPAEIRTIRTRCWSMSPYSPTG